jgi:hypothetical protein
VNREEFARLQAELKETQRSYVTKDEFQQFSTTVIADLPIKDELQGRRRK